MSPPSSEPRRIVSLFPAATETLFVLEAFDRVVAVSHECDFPPSAQKLPRATRSRVGGVLEPGKLDAAIRTLAAGHQSLFELDVELLQRLKPDLLIAQTDCELCAVTPQDVERVLGTLRPLPEIETFGARTFEKLLHEIRRLGQRLHRGEEAKYEILKQWGLAKEIRARVAGLGRPRVAVLDWVDPVMFAGHWTRELVEMAGGEYTLVSAGQPSRRGSWDELEEYEADVLVAAPCGRSVATASNELKDAIAQHDLWDLAAVEQQRAFAADGNQFFNRPGPRLIYSAAILARALHWQEVPPLPPAIEAGLVRLELLRPSTT